MLKNGTRTRDPNLGKVVLYQLSYFRENPAKKTLRDCKYTRKKSETKIFGEKNCRPATGPATHYRGSGTYRTEKPSSARIGIGSLA